MAYSVRCVLLAREVGHEFSLASARYHAQMANARFAANFGFNGKANQIKAQAKAELEAKRSELINRMEVNGCL